MRLGYRLTLVAVSTFALLALVALFWLHLGPTHTPPARAQETTTIQVGDNWFCGPSFQNGVCDTIISVGDTVAWDFSGALALHTTTDCGTYSCDTPTTSPLWDSGFIDDGSTYQSTFNEPGIYLYYCLVHPGPIGSFMRGRIFVNGPTTPTATSTPTLTQTSTATTTATATATTTAVATAAVTDTPTRTATPTVTATMPTAAATATPTPTVTTTATPTATAASTPVDTATPTPTATDPATPTRTVTTTGTPTAPRLVGDVGCDGTVNSIDAALILQLDAGLIDSLACQDAADVNEDGTINSIDAALILQFDAGLIERLPP